MPSPTPRLRRPFAARAGGILAWIVILVIAAGAYYGYQKAPKAVVPVATDAPPANLIQMRDVKIEAFDENFRQTMDLHGKTATSYKDSSDLVLEPTDGVILREAGRHVHVVCGRTQKIVQKGQPERLEFTGAVNVTSEDRKLLSEKLVYTPSTRLLESAAPVQVITTGSIILADHLKTQTDVKTGVLDGNVQITSLGEGGRPLAAPVLVRGAKADFDLTRAIFDVTGSAWAKQAGQDVRADRMIFNRKRNTLTAHGNAVASRPDLTVTAGHLEYWIDREAGVATEGPKAVQATPRTTTEEETRSELIAKTLEMDFKRSIMEGKDDVQLERKVWFENAWERDYKITANSVTSLYTTGRSTFRESVNIDSSQVGATGDRAVFYQKTGKLYIIGNKPKNILAHAWEKDEDGQKTNETQGRNILHDLRTGKSQVLGETRIVTDEGREKKRPAAPPKRPRRQGVEIKFNEGDE